MARYNTITPTTSTTGAASISAPAQGLVTTFTGSAPYTVTLASPVLYIGVQQSFYNATSGTVTISTPSGQIKGPGFTAATSQAVPTTSTYTVVSDGTDYIIINNEGGPQYSTSGTFTGTLTAQSTVAMSPANANVTISPSGTGTVTMAPATAGTINNIAIGGTTRAAGSFTTLDANGNVTLGDATGDTVTLNGTMSGGLGTIDGGTY